MPLIKRITCTPPSAIGRSMGWPVPSVHLFSVEQTLVHTRYSDFSCYGTRLRELKLTDPSTVFRVINDRKRKVGCHINCCIEITCNTTFLSTQLVVEPLQDESLPLQRGLLPRHRPPALRRTQVSHLGRDNQIMYDVRTILSHPLPFVCISMKCGRIT